MVASNGRVYDDRTHEWTDPGTPESNIDYELSATWAGDRLVFFGGFDDDAGYDDTTGLSNETWIWTRRD